MSTSHIELKKQEEEIKNADIDLDIIFELENIPIRKKVWASPLKLDEKQSDDDLLYYIKELMKLGRIWEAGELAEKLPLHLQNSKSIRFLKDEKRLIATRIGEIEDLKGWDLQVDGSKSNSNGISVWYRYTSGSPVVKIRTKFVVEASFKNICTVANEIDLWSMFMGKILAVDTKLCAKHGFMTVVPYMNIHFPWPMSNRECYGEMRVYDLIAEKKLCLLVFEDVGDRSEILGFKIPKPTVGSISMKSKMLGMAKTVSWNKTDVTLLITVDLVIPVPQWFVDWLTRQVAWHITREFQKFCTNLPEAHLERIKADISRLYEYIDDRMGIVFNDIDEHQTNEMEKVDI